MFTQYTLNLDKQCDKVYVGDDVFKEIEKQCRQVLREFLKDVAPGSVLLVSCSTSEIGGHKRGTMPSPDIASLILETICDFCYKKKIVFAVQCCDQKKIIWRPQTNKFSCAVISGEIMQLGEDAGCFAQALCQGGETVFIKSDAYNYGLEIGTNDMAGNTFPVSATVDISHNHIGGAKVNCFAQNNA